MIRTGTLAWLPAILEKEGLDAVDVLLLVALADHVNAEDACFVGIDTLARQARTSYATARRRLKGMEDAGLIIRSRRRQEGTGNLSVYDFTLCRGAFGLTALALTVSGSQRSPRRAVASAHPDERAEVPRIEPPHMNTTADAVDPFDEWWTLYPVKKSKAKARSCYRAALKRATVQEVLDGLKRSVAFWREQRTEPRFIPHASTWLNGDRWEDELNPQQAALNDEQANCPW